MFSAALDASNPGGTEKLKETKSLLRITVCWFNYADYFSTE